MAQSRLSKNLTKKTKKQLFVTILIIIGILVFLVKFGIPLFVNFSLYITGNNKISAPVKASEKEFIAPPSFNQTFSATNSATVAISGNSIKNQTILLYNNDQLIDTTDAGDDNSFKFANVTLKEGDNNFKAKVKKESQESDFSDIWKIIYKKGDVKLTVDNPQDGQSFSKDQNSVIINGKTDPNNLVTVSDHQAIVDVNGNFSYDFHLQNGDNELKVIATDEAGNKTEKDLKVTYSQ